MSMTPQTEIPHDAPNDDSGTIFSKVVQPKAVSKPRDPLPPQARANLIALQGQRDDARLGTTSAVNRMAELRKGLGYGAQSEEEAEATNIELDRLDKARLLHDKRHRAFANLVTRLETWLRTLPRDTVLVPVRRTTVHLSKNESLPEAIARVRTEIASAQAGLSAVQSAPLPKAALKQAARDYVDGLTLRGRPRLNSDRNGLTIRFDDPEAYGVSHQSALRFLAWLHGPAMLSALERDIDIMPEQPDAMTVEGKTQQLAKGRAALEALEVREEALVASALEQGFDVLRRPDVSPSAVLGVMPRP